VSAWLLQFAYRRLRDASPSEVWTWLQEHPEWPVKRLAGAMEVGDPVVLWASGTGGGVRAIGHLTAVTPESRGAGTCHVSWTENLLAVEDPVGREQLRASPVLAEASIVRQPFGSNPFRLTEEQWAELVRLLEVNAS